jgi:hypothetical protein
MVTLTRLLLYKWIWTCPISKVATEVGISGSAIAKKCRAYNIPTPGRGYWRRVEQKIDVQRSPLPDPEGYASEVPLKVSEERALLLEQLPAFAFKIHARSENEEIPPAQVAKNVEIPHEKLQLNEKSPSSGDQLPMGGNGASWIDIEGSSQERFGPRQILQAASKLETIEVARRFLRALNAASQTCDPPTRAVLILWVQLAREVLTQADPVGNVLSECQLIANGKVTPPWYAALQQQSR